MEKHESNAQARENMNPGQFGATVPNHAIQPKPSAEKHSTISLKGRKMRHICFDNKVVKILEKNLFK